MAAMQFFFDYRSPYSYLAQTQFGTIGADVSYHPFDLVALMKLVENVPTSVTCKPKNRYVLKDMQRWAARYGAPVNRHPDAAKIDARRVLRATLAAAQIGEIKKIVPIIFDAYWKAAKPLGNAQEIAVLMASAGLNATKLEPLIDSPEMDKALDEATARAAELGVFGSPTFFVGDDMFFGNDRLDFVREALATAA